LALEISETIVARLPIPEGRRHGPLYQIAIEASVAYWQSVLAGNPNQAACAASSRALSALMGCNTTIHARKRSLKEKFLKAIS